jgi:sodium/pantothenate symporter
MNLALLFFLAYSGLLLAIGLWSYRIVEKVPIAKYEEEFYAAGRGLGGVVVALIIAAGLASAGTFIAGPGMTYEYGYSWVLINSLGIFMSLLLAPVGILIGIAARRAGAVTYLDLFRARYESKAVVLILAVLVTLYLIPYMATQFVGAARVIGQMTGMSYIASLALGSLVVLVYCVLGGMRATSLATMLQGIVISVACVMLFVGAVHAAGGLAQSTETIAALDPSLLSVTANGQFPASFLLSMAIMGFFIIGLPHGMLGALTYKNTQALKRAIWLGCLLVFIWVVPLCIAGTIGRALIPDLAISDEIAPWLAMNVLPTPLGGVALAGIVAGIQTTVAAMAILITSSVARNVVQELNIKLTPGQNKVLSRVTMAACLGLAILLALAQPKLIQWIILFSVGGLEAATFAPILLGVFWRRGTTWGALAAIGSGTISYVLAFVLTGGSMVFGMHPSVPAVGLSVVVYVLVSLVTPAPSEAVVRTFWGGSKATSS